MKTIMKFLGALGLMGAMVSASSAGELLRQGNIERIGPVAVRHRGGWCRDGRVRRRQPDFEASRRDAADAKAWRRGAGQEVDVLDEDGAGHWF